MGNISCWLQEHVARDRQWKGRVQCRAGEGEQRPSMRLSMAAWWNAQTNTKWHSAVWCEYGNRGLE